MKYSSSFDIFCSFGNFDSCQRVNILSTWAQLEQFLQARAQPSASLRRLCLHRENLRCEHDLRSRQIYVVFVKIFPFLPSYYGHVFIFFNRFLRNMNCTVLQCRKSKGQYWGLILRHSLPKLASGLNFLETHSLSLWATVWLHDFALWSCLGQSSRICLHVTVQFQSINSALNFHNGVPWV